MTDLLERLTALDPATDAALAEARRAAHPEMLRDRIVTMPFDRVPRWRVALRRPRPAIRRVVVIVTALLVAIAGIAIPLRWFGGDDDVVPAAPADRLLTTSRQIPGSNEVSAVAFVDLDTGTVSPIGSGRTQGSSPVWSPDGSQIAFVRDAGQAAEIVLADASGENQRVLGDAASSTWASLAWSPDGSAIVVYGSGHELRRIEVATGEVATIPEPRDIYLGGPIAWSPDGSTFAFVAMPEGDPNGFSYLYGMDVDGGNVHQLVPEPVVNLRTPPAWSPDGRTLVYEDWTNELAALDLESGRTVQLTDSANDSGTIVGISTAPTFSPDGARIAFLRNSSAGPYDVWVMDADGDNERQVTHVTNTQLESLDWHPAPSPGRGSSS